MQARARVIGLVSLTFAALGPVPTASAQSSPQVAVFDFGGTRTITSTQGGRVSGVVVGANAEFFDPATIAPIFSGMAVGAFNEKVSQGGRTVTGTVTFQFQGLTAADTLTFGYTQSLVGGTTNAYIGALTSVSGTGVFQGVQMVLDPTDTSGIAGLVTTVTGLGMSDMEFTVNDLVMPIGVP